jgi:hypothetical protein
VARVQNVEVRPRIIENADSILQVAALADGHDLVVAAVDRDDPLALEGRLRPKAQAPPHR